MSRILSRSADYTGKVCTANVSSYAKPGWYRLLPGACADKRDRLFEKRASRPQRERWASTMK